MGWGKIYQDVDFQKSLTILRNNYYKVAEALIGNIDEIYDEIRISKHSGIPGEKNNTSNSNA
ncbi:hypothetical protein [Lysinibacillus xylanilyticus]|uniref:hypothetical protein n=1 Tax=Lysinibacillus xylanilyticus TaxID=582475 RepID=UPI00382A84D1